jgi:thiamine pyrophosphate-dependent acetolactate synthase large subunit-like protein
VHLVAQNDTCGADGNQPMPKVDFAGIARGIGYATACDFSDLKNYEQQIGHVLEQERPVFATLHVEPSKKLKYNYPSMYDPEKRKVFKAQWRS